MKLNKYIIPLLAALTPTLTPTPAQAQQCLSFSSAMTLAAEQDPAVLVAKARQQEAQSDLQEAQSLYRPQVSAFGRTDVVDSTIQNNGQRFRADIHGTAVTGIIAAQPNNALGIVGLSPGAEESVLKACWQLDDTTSKAHCNSFTVASAISHAIDSGADIINMSLAGPRDPLIARLVVEAQKKGILVVAADPGDAASGYPARLPGVIAVCRQAPADVQPDRLLIRLNSADVLTTAPDGGFDFFSGSSMSAAKVSAVTALMKEKHPDLKPEQVVANFKHMFPFDNRTGYDSRRLQSLS